MDKKDVNVLVHIEKKRGIETASVKISGDKLSLMQVFGNIVDIYIKNEIMSINEITLFLKEIELERRLKHD